MKDEFVENMPFNLTSVKRTNERFDKTKVNNEQRKAMYVPPILFFFQSKNRLSFIAILLEKLASISSAKDSILEIPRPFGRFSKSGENGFE